MLIEVSIAEVFDKISILKIKLDKIKDPDKIINITKEFLYLLQVLREADYNLNIPEYTQLLEINQQIWEAEESIRELSNLSYREACDTAELAHVAISIHQLNDERARIKKGINLQYSSKFIEEKSYEGM